jgi:hypothetical protein
MDERTYHGNVTTEDFARALLAEFRQGNLQAQAIGRGDKLTVQIASASFRESGGQTALAVELTPVEDGVHVRLGQQQWLGVVASLGETLIRTLRNPWLLLGRLDDLAQDVLSLQLTENVWRTIARTADALGASTEISERLRRVTCAHCLTANAVGAPSCTACGAPLGPAQPAACPGCGFVVAARTTTCPRCGAALPAPQA